MRQSQAVRHPLATGRFAGLRNCFTTLCTLQIPHGIGVAAVSLVIVASVGYGAVRGGHVSEFLTQLADARDALANAAGFRIASIGISGEKEISRDDVLAQAGITGRSSLLFLDAAATRAKLKSNAWIADANLLKLYPGRLDITLVERHAFALWQKDGQVSVIADDGIVVQSFVDTRFSQLPLLVGAGAERKGREFLDLLDRYPGIRDQVRASILVAERRWNLKLKNGIDVRLPEYDTGHALQALASLDRDKQLLTRDIVDVDLRLADRVTVRLSDDAAAARAEALKDKKPKRKGGDA